MRIYPLSPKCKEALRDSNYRINFFIGAVRAGKTFTSVLRWIRFITKEVKPGEMVAITGKSTATIEKNIISLITELVGPEHIKYNSSKGLLWVFGVKHTIVGANDESSKNKIQGNTLKGALADEVCLYPKSFINMLDTRLSLPGAKMFMTANPEGPNHFMRTEFILREDEINEKSSNGKAFKAWNFTMEDNLSLDEDYKNDLKATLRGVFYRRLVLGEWVAAEGLIYDMYYDEDVLDLVEKNRDGTPNENLGNIIYPSHVVNTGELLRGANRTRFKHYLVGVDYGITNPTAFVMLGYDEYFGPKYIVKEYYYDSKNQPEQRQKTDGEFANDLVGFIRGYNVSSIFIDPSAASFKVECLRKGLFTTDANNDVIDGIRYVSTMFAGYELYVDEKCENIRRELQEYSWEPSEKSKGKDIPIKDKDHTLDSLRYILYTNFGLYGNGIQAGRNRR